MERHVEERFERIERGFQECNEILKNTINVLNRTANIAEETWILARENQKRLDLLLADGERGREESADLRKKIDEHIEEMRRERQREKV